MHALAALIVLISGEESRPLYDPVASAWGCVAFFPLTFAGEELKGCVPDLFLLDCGFQTERGLRILHEIKSRWQNVPIIFLTDASSEEMVISVFKAGAREYFKKPVNTHELMETVENLLQLKRGATEKRTSLRARRQERLPLPATTSAADLPENLLRAVRYIEKNLAASLSLEGIAGEACVSKFHFCRVFKEHLRMSPMSFVNLMRMERAKRLLGKNLSVAAVALKAGFNDQSSFNRHFKRFTGFTPTAYRDSLKK